MRTPRNEANVLTGLTLFGLITLLISIGIPLFEAPQQAQSTVLPIKSVVCTGSWKFDTTGIGQYGCANAFDGLTTDSVSGGPTGNATFWAGREQQDNETLTFDLGGIFSISSVDLYNTHNHINNDRGTVNFKIWVSTTLPPPPDNNPSSSFGTLVLSNTLVFYPSIDPNPRQSFSFSSTLGRYVTFRAENWVFNAFHGDGGTGLSEIVVHGATTAPACTPAPSGLVGWWPGDGNANDIIGNINGNLENGATFATGTVGQAFSFDGVAADVRVPHNDNQNTGAQISVDAWIFIPNPLVGFTTASIINKRSSGNSEGYTFELVNGFGGDSRNGFQPVNNGLQFEITTTNGSFLNAIVGNVVGPGQWYHVAGTYDGSTIRVFVNGSEVARKSATGPIVPVTADLVIGKNIVNGGSFPGLIDEVEIFNRALTLAEIQGIFNAGSAGKCKQTQTTISVAAVTATFGGTANLQATLTRTSDNSGVSGKMISFTLNDNAAGTATTDTSGVATLTGVSLASINPGAYPAGIGASFAGDTSFATSSGTGPLTVNKALAITNANSTTFIVGTAGSFTLTATGFPAPTLSENGALPSGVTFNAATGALSGTPAASTGGTYNISFMASNGVGSDAVQSFTLTVNQAPAITSANSTTFSVGIAGSFNVTATGFPAPTLSEGGALPSGVTFNAATGVLSGTPGAGMGGTYNISFTASNGVGTNAMQNFTLTVLGPAAPKITSPNSTTFTVGTASSFTVTATGLPVPTLSRTGALPGGVTFNAATGVLSGTPAAGTGGTRSLTFTARNGVAPNAVQTFTLTVLQAPAITSAASATFTVGTARSFTVRATGFPAPTLSQLGTLPSGLTFNAATGVLSGTPAAGTGGIHNISFKASNGVGADAVQNFALTVRQAPAITSPNSTTFTVGVAGSFTVTATGFPVPTLSRTGALPNGVTFNAATGVLSGTPAAGTRGIRNITFRARDGVAPPAVQAFTLTVN